MFSCVSTQRQRRLLFWESHFSCKFLLIAIALIRDIGAISFIRHYWPSSLSAGIQGKVISFHYCPCLTDFVQIQLFYCFIIRFLKISEVVLVIVNVETVCSQAWWITKPCRPKQICLQTVQTQMRRLLKIYTVCYSMFFDWYPVCTIMRGCVGIQRQKNSSRLKLMNDSIKRQTGPSCSKLTMSLVNVSLNLGSLNMAYTLIFLLKMWVAFAFAKATHIFQQKYLWIRYCTY